MTEDARRQAPAAARNRDPILAVLREALPPSGLVLELASGTGEHAVHFSRALPALTWQPTDPDAGARESIAAWREAEALPNLLPPLALDAAAPQWPVEAADAIVCINMDSNSCEAEKSAAYRKYDACVCINMVHISEWEATIGLFRGCSKYLTDDAPIILYGPYLEDDVETAPSNVAFDRSLRERNPAWGLRKVADVDNVAANFGFKRSNRYGMPANNLMLVYRHQAV
ncbi:DUF938 domain-containing protein [Novosphingobium beihaiensis]|uniref:Class I SAM-dependent methyltransferase n=1 Tax=Novosphingobium beihaiensis TaxID=2930389 RepID=A0ABT0BWI6_9SPHN|nr:DUF938 domain-containing protein [Novosphingobium beihaiensis]MCJ2189258.1 class I SAM-dependent methyltransferase [Novosphingobium beihaiensis]